MVQDKSFPPNDKNILFFEAHVAQMLFNKHFLFVCFPGFFSLVTNTHKLQDHTFSHNSIPYDTTPYRVIPHITVPYQPNQGGIGLVYLLSSSNYFYPL